MKSIVKYTLLSLLLITSLYSNEIIKIYKSYKQYEISDFFNQWQKEIKPISLSEFHKLEPIIKDSYQIFKLFYNPLNLDKYGDFEWGNDVYKNIKYAVVQNNINIFVLNDITEKDILKLSFQGINSYLRKIELNNFRPRINLPKVSVVYLNSEYKKIITDFLLDENVSMGESNIMQPSYAKGESRNRENYLNKYIKILHGHWKGWIIETNPHVHAIYFNKNRTVAVLNFQLLYQGGLAIFKKEKNKWILLKSYSTWTE